MKINRDVIVFGCFFVMFWAFVGLIALGVIA